MFPLVFPNDFLTIEHRYLFQMDKDVQDHKLNIYDAESKQIEYCNSSLMYYDSAQVEKIIQITQSNCSIITQ